MAKKIKTEHAGAKNGGGHWGTRAEAKTLVKKLRRRSEKVIVRKVIQKEDDKLFQKIRNLVNFHDPEGLSPGQPNGSYEDEYDLEVSKIVEIIRRNPKMETSLIKEKLEDIWLECFNKSCSKLDELSLDIEKIR